MTDPIGGIEWHAVHRCVLPDPGDDARSGLYVRGGRRVSRRALELGLDERASYATYFGAFPAAYWAHSALLDRVRLAVRVDGVADIVIRSTDATGAASTLATLERVEGDATFEVPLGADSGWLWCDAIGRTSTTTVSDVQWQVASARRTRTSLTVCITTFNREADCVGVLRRLAAAIGTTDVIDRVLVADQGSRRVRDAAGFDEVSSLLGERLAVIEQPNLGGSGGFSRGMLDAAAGSSSHVLLLDDDVDLETESLLRLAAFAEAAAEPTIVGAQMLSLLDQTTLHSFGERVSRRGSWWGPVDPSLTEIDLAVATVETTPALSRRIDVDFNGWWMCLIPTAVIRRIGASMPYFIKWDDAEFGLRAAADGVPTVTLPGAALWHMPWTAKDDGLDWQAYFQLRNRIVTALLHGGAGVAWQSFPQDVNHVLCAQYGSIALRNLALRDILDGPGHFDAVLAAGPARPGRLLHEHGQVVVPFAELAPTLRTVHPLPPRGRSAAIGRAMRVLFHQLRAPRPAGAPVRMARTDGKWWSVGLLDHVAVDAAAGTGALVFRRRRTVALRELGQAVALRARLRLTWRRTARDYRNAARRLTSAAAWDERFGR